MHQSTHKGQITSLKSWGANSESIEEVVDALGQMPEQGGKGWELTYGMGRNRRLGLFKEGT